MPLELDNLPAAFAAELLKHFPGWKPFMRTLETPGSARAGVEFAVPQEHTGRALILSADADQIITRFDQWHFEVGPFLGLDIESTVSQAPLMITAFVEERYVVEIVHGDGMILYSGLCSREIAKEPEPHATTYTYSWLGTYDSIATRP